MAGTAQETFVKSVISLRNEFSGLYYKGEGFFCQKKRGDVVVVKHPELAFEGTREQADQIVERARLLAFLYNKAQREVAAGLGLDGILLLNKVLKPIDCAAEKVNRMLAPIEQDFRLK